MIPEKPHPWCQTVSELCRILGGVEDDDRTGSFTFLWTIGGPLTVQAMHWNAPWVACRFQYPQAAHGRVSGHLNPWSGKWNFHPMTDSPTLDDLAEFAELLCEVIIPASYRPPHCSSARASELATQAARTLTPELDP